MNLAEDRRARRKAQRHKHMDTPPPPGQTSALCATETATPALVLPATDDAAPVATPRSGRVQFPWWTST